MSKTDPINLVLVYIPDAVDVEDFRKIAERVKAVADNINVHILRDEPPGPGQLEQLAEHPTLVFSPLQLAAFHVNRGRVYSGRPMLKSEQLLRLQLAGVPVPQWESLDRSKRFDPEEWGEYVVVKPEIGSRSRGVTIFKTEELNRQSSRIKPFRRGAENLVVQKLIYNKFYSKIRIQTLFDEILFSRRFCFLEKVKFDTEADIVNYQRLFTTENTQAEDFNSKQIFNMCKKCFAAFDDVPMLALDIMLDEEDKPFFIEANPGGNTWHFSSAMVGRKLKEKGVFLEKQFDAFNLAGETLVKRAMEDAV
jgi:hypothetical protein